MVAQYTWFILILLSAYVLYCNNYYAEIIKNYVKDYHFKTVQLFYENTGEVIKDNGEILFTSSALKKYTNLQNGLYLAILGQVFDVTNGEKHYSPGESYHAFTGTRCIHFVFDTCN